MAGISSIGAYRILNPIGAYEPASATDTDLVIASSEQTQESDNIILALGGTLVMQSTEQVQEASAANLINAKSYLACADVSQLQEITISDVFMQITILCNNITQTQEAIVIAPININGLITILITLV